MKKRKIVRRTLSAVAVATTVGAVLAAGAAAYFFTQTKAGKATAKKVKTIATGLSKEISTRLHAVKKLTQARYDEIVDQVVDEYAAQRKVAGHTVVALKRDLKTHWREVKRELAKR